MIFDSMVLKDLHTVDLLTPSFAAILHWGLPLESQLERARHAVALLPNRYLGRAVTRADVVVRSRARYEKDEVAVLLNRPALPEVGQLRLPVAGAFLDFAIELGNGNDRNIELLGQVFETAADLCHLLNPVFEAMGAGKKLKVVDDQKANAMREK
jgi:hypothetical protein